MMEFLCHLMYSFLVKAVNIKVLGVTLVKMSWGLMILVSSEFCDQLLPSFRIKHMYDDTALLCHPEKLAGYCHCCRSRN